jgi:CRISPR-associated protein Csm5
MPKQNYKITLTPLTGVHIGTGEILTPLDYKLAYKMGNVDFKKPTYFKFSTDKILKRLIDEKVDLTAFERASVEGNTRELQKFFHAKCTAIKDTDYPCDVTDSFLRTYNDNIKKDAINNAAQVFQMYHPEGSPKPVIPGSSIKGSIRTALLNYYLKDVDADTLSGDKDALIQKKLLHYNDAKDDPLRCIMISDSSFQVKCQLVGQLKNIAFNKVEQNLFSLDKLQIQAEIIPGSLTGGSAVSDISIGIDKGLQAAQNPKDHSRIMPISMADIISACNEFYLEEFLNEYDTFYREVYDGSTDLITELKKQLEAAVKEKNQFIIRVGRWSQVEFVTLGKDLRNPKTPSRNNRQMGWGGTRTVFDYDGKYLPMGWCILKVED